ncbi:hypothetical protein UFOVP141_21 [uncultured Caudovirales phage]|uniref:Uncharacterized protein n=1 Tax=uncultured Caudovirales phage TaxID=2100421 RepID=A0A6J7VL71_9CAUD|nr:hypothetical protein UFOVP141_21 [uncultured Caudovirales phage]
MSDPLSPEMCCVQREIGAMDVLMGEIVMANNKDRTQMINRLRDYAIRISVFCDREQIRVREQTYEANRRRAS